MGADAGCGCRGGGGGCAAAAVVEEGDQERKLWDSYTARNASCNTWPSSPIQVSGNPRSVRLVGRQHCRGESRAFCTQTPASGRLRPWSFLSEYILYVLCLTDHLDGRRPHACDAEQRQQQSAHPGDQVRYHHPDQSGSVNPRHPRWGEPDHLPSDRWA